MIYKKFEPISPCHSASAPFKIISVEKGKLYQNGKLLGDVTSVHKNKIVVKVANGSEIDGATVNINLISHSIPES
jgi:hypothetical protein